MRTANMRSRLRQAFGDKYSVQWSDDLLDEIIYEAMREYAYYSRRLIKQTELYSGKSALLLCPVDFIAVQKVFDMYGREVPVFSYRRLATEYGDFRKIKGDVPLAVCFDFDNFGVMRIFPQLPENTYIGVMHYSSIPLSVDWKTVNENAVEAYALYLMNVFTGKQQAALWYDKFLTEVNNQLTAQSLIGNSRTVRSGSFF